MSSKTSPAAKFMIAIIAIIVLLLAGGVWLNTNEQTAMRIAFVPGHSFAEEAEEPRLDYADDASWFALPSNETYVNLAPEGIEKYSEKPNVDVFFVHPTTYLIRGNWSAPLDDSATNKRTQEFSLKNQASSFSAAGNIYAPRYRQAAFGAFFDDGTDGIMALQRAYTDIVVAFDAFIERRNPENGIILAGHSQGSLHLLRLLKDRFDGTELTKKLVAAYLIGWPVSIEADIGAVEGVDICDAPTQTGCVISYQTFGKHGETETITGIFNATPGLNGTLRAGTQMLCTNPLSWTVGDSANRTEHMGSVELLSGNAPLPAPIPNFIGASCHSDGILFLAQPLLNEEWNQFTMTGENYHAYDFNMFYMNIRDNAHDRALAWTAAQQSTERTPDGTNE
ncbi:hypothetical protein GCM10017044_20810 [Kordiimonas sediminis]|uniref:DUF3089 domain-containing protein n=1 Tax=Kordiimonas sediminis TaxID=1735581 RepID=A0A919E8Q8_9PROT|nr:DUF3089 domain-containing protein [Kordiimonas sediminis]GHF25817.1 hypothetical protein GCM10017044_20810 [Kordiimonas sediminis]